MLIALRFVICLKMNHKNDTIFGGSKVMKPLNSIILKNVTITSQLNRLNGDFLRLQYRIFIGNLKKKNKRANLFESFGTWDCPFVVLEKALFLSFLFTDIPSMVMVQRSPLGENIVMDTRRVLNTARLSKAASKHCGEIVMSCITTTREFYTTKIIRRAS